MKCVTIYTQDKGMHTEEQVWYFHFFCIVFTIVYLFWDLILVVTWLLKSLVGFIKLCRRKSSSRLPFLNQEELDHRIENWKGNIKRVNLNTSKVVKKRWVQFQKLFEASQRFSMILQNQLWLDGTFKCSGWWRPMTYHIGRFISSGMENHRPI